MAEQWQLCHVTVVTRVTISLADLEISGNLSTAKKMPGNWPVVGEVSGNKSCRGKLFISLLAGTPMFNRWFRPCLAFVRILVLLYNWYTHTHLTALCPGLPRWAGTRKVKPIWILLEQETVSGSGISWAICNSAHRCRQITTPAPHHSVFYRLDALPAAQPTASKHWRHSHPTGTTTLRPFNGLFSWAPWQAGTRKVKPVGI